MPTMTQILRAKNKPSKMESNMTLRRRPKHIYRARTRSVVIYPGYTRSTVYSGAHLLIACTTDGAVEFAPNHYPIWELMLVDLVVLSKAVQHANTEAT